MCARQLEPFAHYSSAFPSGEHSCQVQHGTFKQDGDNEMKFEGDMSQDSNLQKRQHPFQLDPEFYSALDSSVSEQLESGCDSWRGQHSTLPKKRGSPWPVTPSQKSRRAGTRSDLLSLSEPANSSRTPSSSGPASPSTIPDPASWYLDGRTSARYRDDTLNSSTHSDFSGPTIVDLSSGEELVALHLGENDHKRKRDSTCEPTLISPAMDSLRTVFEFQEDGSLLPILVHCPTRPFAVKKVRLGKLYDIQSCGT